MLSRLPAVATVLILAYLPSTAVADDAAVVEAWHSGDSRLAELRQDFKRASGAWWTRDNARPGPVLRVVARQRRTVERVWRRVDTEEPSTASGILATEAVLRSLDHSDRQYALTASGVRLVARGRAKAGFRQFGRAGRSLIRARRAAREARRLFQDGKSEPPLA